MKNQVMRFFLLLTLGIALPVHSKDQKATLTKGRFSVNFENTMLTDALHLLAVKAGLKLDAPEKLGGSVNYSFANVSLKQALDQICEEKDLNYQVAGGRLVISEGWTTTATRGPASLNGSDSNLIRLRFISAGDALGKVSTLLSGEDRIIKDEPTNSLVFMGKAQTLSRIRETLSHFDVMPPQILIEAHIVEINKNKSLEFGFNYGEISNPSLSGVTAEGAVISNPEPKVPNLAIQVGLGALDGRSLAARLAAAEVDGSAKILSRPKVVTINNKAADISSGITYTVRTLAAVNTGGSGSGTGDSATTVGVSQVEAGLNLSVTPTVVDGNKVKLVIQVDNSEPDESTLVDGIPGIVRNTTNTEIIVNNRTTASVAGLVKNTFAESRTGLPFIHRIPLIGWLFGSRAKANRDKELMVFITPTIVNGGSESGRTLKDVQDHFPEIEIMKPEAKLVAPKVDVTPVEAKVSGEAEVAPQAAGQDPALTPVGPAAPVYGPEPAPTTL